MLPRILVATDGAPGALGALRLARQVHRRQGSRVEVLAACEPSDYYRIPIGSRQCDAPPPVPWKALDLVRSRVAAQLANADLARLQWPLDVERGPPAPAIQRSAVRKRSSLILMGLPRTPSPVDFWLGRETVQKVVQLAHVPVLAVPPATSELPRRALVALDFSRFSTRAAWDVLRLLAPRAHLHLAHVLAEPLDDGEVWQRDYEWAERYRPGVNRQLEELAAALRGVAGVTTHLHPLPGEPAHAILQLAEQVDADLLAFGSHGHGYIGRMLMGSTCGRLIRGARTAMLVVPPAGIPRELARLGDTADAAATDRARGTVTAAAPEPHAPGVLTPRLGRLHGGRRPHLPRPLP